VKGEKGKGGKGWAWGDGDDMCGGGRGAMAEERVITGVSHPISHPILSLILDPRRYVPQPAVSKPIVKQLHNLLKYMQSYLLPVATFELHA